MGRNQIDSRTSSAPIGALLQKDSLIAEATSIADERERHVEGWLAPAVARRRSERDLLRRKLDALQTAARERREARERVLHLETSLLSARAEIDALRRSMSWRLTAPLRVAYGWWLAVRGGS